MSQHGFRGWVMSGFDVGGAGISCAPGFFQNAGECGIQMSMYFPLALFFLAGVKPYLSRGRYWLVALLPLTAAASLITASSRGALLGLGAVLIWLVLRNPKNIKGFIGAVLLAGAVWYMVPEKQKLRFQDMGEDDTSVSRLTYWAHAREIMQEYPVLGIGYANWLPYYLLHYDRQGQMVHNIFYQAGAELGFTGLGVFIAMILATFYTNRKTRRLARQLPDGGRFLASMASGLDGALVGFLVTGYFITVLYYPFFWINLAMTVALHCSTLHEVKQQRRALAFQAAAGRAG
jgi:putative inorganic carbon (hco3(-)) transporter